MKYLSLIVLLLAIASVYSKAAEREKGVLILTADSFQETLDTYDHVLVMFYAPWCGHCKKLHPEFEAAATQLQESGSLIQLANVDATEETALAAEFGVQGYPTIKFFIQGKAVDYAGPRESNGIIGWVEKKSQPATLLLDEGDLETLKTNNEVMVVFFGEEESEEFKSWGLVSAGFDDFVFYHNFDETFATEQGVTHPSVVLFKQFDELRNQLTEDLSADNMKEFVNTYSRPSVMRFDQKSAQYIFGEGQMCLFLFSDLESEGHDDLLAQLTGTSDELTGKILLSYSGISEGLDQKLAEYIGVTSDFLPSVWLVDPTSKEMQKYHMEEDITTENILAFYAEYEQGNLKTHIKSEEVPEQQSESVIVVVGKSWNDVVLDETKDVLMEYYAPWCGHCKSLAPKYLNVADKLKELGCDNIVIGKMDATANEVEGLNIEGFPTLKFYPANNKEPMDYQGDRDEEGFYRYLNENASSVVNCDLSSLLVEEDLELNLGEAEEAYQVINDEL